MKFDENWPSGFRGKLFKDFTISYNHVYSPGARADIAWDKFFIVTEGFCYSVHTL